MSADDKWLRPSVRLVREWMDAQDATVCAVADALVVLVRRKGDRQVVTTLATLARAAKCTPSEAMSALQLMHGVSLKNKHASVGGLLGFVRFPPRKGVVCLSVVVGTGLAERAK